MKDKNNNMEEFFKRSLERFDELPSDDVWTGVSDRLTMEANWYDPILSVLKSIYPFLLAFAIVGAYHLYAQNNIAKLKEEFSNAQSGILGNGNENESLNETVRFDEVKEEFLVKINEKNKLIDKLENDLTILNTNYKNLKASSRQKIQAESEYTTVLNLQNEIAQLKEKLSIQNVELISLRQKSDSNNLSPSTRSTEVFCSSFRHLPGVKTHKIYNQNGLHALMNPKRLVNKRIEIEEEEEVRNKNRRLSVGVKLKYFNTLVKDSELINPGFSRGIRTEYQMNNKWAITSDFLYNEHAYTINAKTGTLTRESLEKYPGGLEDNTNVNIVNTRSRYFDASLGIKYSPNFQIENFNFFINPSVVWQLYLPQEYQFNLLQESNVSYTANTYTLYFGSGNLSLGFEKRISSKLQFQVSLWGEQSFIPLGIDRQYVSMFGVGSALLF